MELARAIGGFSIGVAAHPAGHPRSPDLPSDRDFLAAKLALADFGVTQFFFEAAEYEALVADLRERGVDTPGAARHPARHLAVDHGPPGRHGCAPRRPGWRSACGRPTSGAAPTRCARRGWSWPPSSAADLLEAGVPGLHFYTFNTSSATREIYAALGLGPATSP